MAAITPHSEERLAGGANAPKFWLEPNSGVKQDSVGHVNRAKCQLSRMTPPAGRFVDFTEVRRSADESRKRYPAQGKRWTYAETILAFLYLTYLDPSKLGGTKIKSDGTVIQDRAVQILAQTLGRTDNSIVLKIQNLRWFSTSGERGMSGGSKTDERVVAYFGGRLDELLVATAAIQRQWPATAAVVGALRADTSDVGVLSREEERYPVVSELRTERETRAAVRVGQALFRARVLANFGACCACCGLRPLRARLDGVFLVAGHIRPWRIASNHERLDPGNGIPFCSLHDRAFEHGLITLDESNRFIVTGALTEWFGPERLVEQTLARYHGKPLQSRSADFAAPASAHLAFHRQEVFESFLETG